MIGLPNLPTDNLYKFFFFGGLTLIIYSSFLYFDQRQSIKEESNSIELNVVKIETENDFITQDLKDIEIKKKNLEIEISNLKSHSEGINYNRSDVKEKLQDRNYREYLSFYYTHINDLYPILAKTALLQTEFKEYSNKENELKLNSRILLVKKNQLKREEDSLTHLLIAVALFIIIGLFFSLFGALKWYNLQKYADEKWLKGLNDQQIN